jgi:NAD(P)-dependent dehydrogenase (short-subunit alcohol dehydrogenase family)
MRRVLVTGGNRGIGLEFVRQLLARGDRVIATCRKPGQAGDLNKLAFANPGRLAVLPLDMAKPASVIELAKEAGLVVDGLDVLINNAGVLVENERWGALDAKALESTFATNVVGPVLLTQALAPLLAKGEAAVVMNLSSILGSIASREGFYTPSYCISKAALNMATRLMAGALLEAKVCVFCIHPGWVKTAMGGPNAEVEPVDSVRGMLHQLDAITPGDSGRFLSWDGAQLPW